MRLFAGLQIGPYRVEDLMYRDEMEEVYRARYMHLDSEVALKVAQSPIGSDHFVRFLEQWRTGALFGHPNVIAVYDFGWYEGRPFVVSEPLQGDTLRARMPMEGPLTPAAGAAFAIQIADGLAAAHRVGVVHGELKPENVLITPAGRVKILNFGRAKSLEETLELVQQDSPAPATRAMLVDMLAYMSPEQASASSIDHRTDIFSLGVMLYEMVAGAGPFRRSSPIQTLRAILEDEPPDARRSNPGIPQDLYRVIRRCLEKDPEQRFQSARDVCFSLELMLTSFTLETRRPGNFIDLPESAMAPPC
jgi:eukaryotic-like serine/threonine-protein kinase